MEAAMRGMYGRHATPGTPRTPARIDTRKVRGTREELFQAVDDEGTRWIFAVLRDAGWSITRNGIAVAAGTDERSSVDAGVKQFTKLIHPIAGQARCDPVIRRRLDEIEADAARNGVGIGVGKGLIATLLPERRARSAGSANLGRAALAGR